MSDVEFLFDFGSPNAYLAWKAMQTMDAFKTAEIKTTPVLLGGIFKSTGNAPPMLAFSGVPAKMKYLGTEMERFQKRHGITDFQFNPNFPVNTLMLMRGCFVAIDEGFLDPYLAAGFHHMWEAGTKMDDPDTFAQAFNEAALDGAHILARSKEPAIKKALMDSTQAAVDRDVFGIPSFFVGDDLYFGKDTLWEIAERIG